ncbi:MAG: hypothetical protein ACOC3D_05415 [Pseudomonadota bacterium]
MMLARKTCGSNARRHPSATRCPPPKIFTALRRVVDQGPRLPQRLDSRQPDPAAIVVLGRGLAAAVFVANSSLDPDPILAVSKPIAVFMDMGFDSADNAVGGLPSYRVFFTTPLFSNWALSLLLQNFTSAPPQAARPQSQK